MLTVRSGSLNPKRRAGAERAGAGLSGGKLWSSSILCWFSFDWPSIVSTTMSTTRIARSMLSRLAGSMPASVHGSFARRASDTSRRPSPWGRFSSIARGCATPERCTASYSQVETWSFDRYQSFET